MLLTIVTDKYESNQREEMAEAIDDICSPDDNWGWSSAGLYCYWDADTYEPLYLGLSVDLPRRFRQHNGLMVTKSGSKKEQIDQYFTENKVMGFSLFLQSHLDQPALDHKDRLHLPGFEGELNIKRGEGILLEAFKLNTSAYPKWNKIGGAKGGTNSAKLGHFHYFSDLTNYNQNSIFRSDLSISELAKDATDCETETIIHGLKMMLVGMAPFRMPLEQAIKRLSNFDQQRLLSNPRGKAWVEKAKSLGF